MQFNRFAPDETGHAMKGTFGLGLFAAFSAVVLWGVQLPIGKDVFPVVGAVHVTFIRYGLATLFLVPVLVFVEGRASLSYRGKVLPAVVFGVIGMCASPMLVFFGMSLSRAEHAVVIIALQPSITAIIQWYAQGRRPANFTLACIVCAFCGVLLVVTKGDIAMAGTPRELLGDFIVLCGAACWVIYTMAINRLAGWSALRLTVLTLIPGLAATGIVAGVLVEAGLIDVPGTAALGSVMWELLYLAIAGVLISMLLWTYGTQRIGALNSSLLINFMPVVTFAVRAWQGHPIAAVEVTGAAMVVLALVANNIYLRMQYLKRSG